MNTGTVHLIATDPPFNKGRDFHATPDSLATGARFQDRWSWDSDVHPEWVDQLADDWPDVLHVIEGSRKSYGDDMGAFLCFMGVRLLEMRRVLRDDGSIYLHCDPTASHYLKELMDAIFGRKSFRNEIIWYYKNASRGKRQFAKAHELLFWYAKDGEGTFNREDVLAPYESGMTEWRYRKAGKEPPRGKTPDDVIVLPALNTMEKERTGYPTQKPLALYQRIVEASSNPGDVVLDPFAGCATTCIAAERLGRQWVGIDIWDKAHDTVIERLQQEGLAAPDDEDERLITFGDIIYSTEPPDRTDDGEEAVPFLPTKIRRALEPWQRLPRQAIVAHLEEAQAKDAEGRVICGGCGRVLEREFMQLDHILPRVDEGSNDISNRILLCGPCNRRKGANYTLSGLVRENKKAGWMQDENLAKLAQATARAMADRVRDGLVD